MRALVEVLERAGVPRHDFLKKAGVAERRLSDGDERFSLAEFDGIQHLALDLTGDEALGLHLAEHASEAAFAVVGHLVSLAPTLRDALELISQFGSLLFGDTHQVVEEHVDVARIRHDFHRTSTRSDRMHAEFTVAGFVRLLRIFAGPEARISGAYFEHAAPAHRHEYHRVFDGAERFRQSFTGIEFPRKLLDVRQLHHDPRLYGVLRAEARRTIDTDRSDRPERDRSAAGRRSSGHPERNGNGGRGHAHADGPAPDPRCDLSGRWLVTQRSVEEGLGVQQALRNWMYFELSQNGPDVTATRGLDCGFDVVPLSAVAGAADLHKAWPKIMQGNPMAGRKGTIEPAASGCVVSFPPYVSVYGATVAYYRDPSHGLPGPNDAASGATPGWEDWDSDGNPGITYNLSGIASGQVFYAGRQTNTWSGAIAQTGRSFTLSLVPKHENDQLGYNGSPLLTTQSNIAANASLHFVELARLDATQATGDDTATCTAVRALATTLTPRADEKPLQ